MKKPFNLRIPVLFAAALALGILYSAILAYFAVDGVFITVPAAVFLCALIAAFFITKKTGKVLVFAVAVLFFVAGAAYMYGIYAAYVRTELHAGQFVRVEGRVVEEGVTSTGEVAYVIINNAKIFGKRVSGKILTYLEDNSGDYCARGYKITFYAYLSKESFISDGNISDRVIDGIRYYCTAHSLEAKYHYSLFGAVNKAIRSALYENLDGETASVCFALLTGNTSDISRATLSAFRYGGIAHVFAVSGLHIGVIYAALSFAFRRTGINRFVSAAIKIATIIFYAGVCNFTPSSVRAVIMCAISALSGCLYRKNDGWNSLSVTAIILLLINPVYLFDVGFVLSFAAVLSIMLLSHNTDRALFFLPAKLRSVLVSCLAVQLGVLPALAVNFGYISAAGLFLNVIFIPLISVLYVILLVCTLLCIIIAPIAPFIMPVCASPIQLLISFVNACGFEKAIIGIDFGYWFYLPFQFLTVALSDKFNFAFKYRSIPLAAFGASLLAVILASVIRINTTVTFGTGFSGGYIVIDTPQGNVLVINETFTGYVSGRDTFDAVVVLGGDESLTFLFGLDWKIDKAYMRGSLLPVYVDGGLDITYADKFMLYDMKFTYKDKSCEIEVGEVKLVFATEEDDMPYGEFEEGGDMYLYAYADDAAYLYDSEYNALSLTYRGDISYTLKGGALKRKGVMPRER